MDKFNYLQPLNNDNDLLAAEILLADDFPTDDISFLQILLQFHTVLSPSEPKLKQQQQQQPNVQDEAADISRFPVISNERYRRAEVSCSKQKYLLLDKTVDEVISIRGAPPAILLHLDINSEQWRPKNLINS